VGVHNRALVAQHEGSSMLAAMYDQLLEVLMLRPSAIVIRSELGAVEDTYASLIHPLQSPTQDET